MLDLFHAIAQLDDLVGYWDVARQPEGGVLFRVKSRLKYATEHAATDIARALVARVHAQGHEVREVRAAARPGHESDPGWHAIVEVVVG